MAHLEPQQVEGRSLGDIPGSRTSIAAEKQAARQSAFQNFLDGVGAGAAAATVRKVQTEGLLRTVRDNLKYFPAAIIAGWIDGKDEDGTPYDKQEFAKKVDQRIDRHMLDDILEEGTIEGAQRVHLRMIDELDRMERMAAQPAGAGWAIMAGGFIDADILLGAVPGAAFGAAKLTGKVVKATRAMGFTKKLSMRTAGLFGGANSGLQGGAIVALLEQQNKETATWADFAAIMVGSTVLGAVVGTATNAAKPLHEQALRAEREFNLRVATDDANLHTAPDIEDMMRDLPDEDLPNMFTDEGLEVPDPDAFNMFHRVDGDGKVIDTPKDGESNLFTAKGVDGEPDGPNAFNEADAENVFEKSFDTGENVFEGEGIVIGGEQPQSLGAAATGSGGRPKRVLVDPDGVFSDEAARWIDKADQHVWDTNFREVRDSKLGKLWHKMAVSRIGSFGMETFTKMYMSKSAVMNYIGGTIFESANGLNRGRATASIMMDAYHRRMQRFLGRQLRPSMNAWARRNGETWAGSGFYISRKGKKAFWREVYLERNERAMRRKSKPADDIDAASNQFDRAAEEGLDIAVGREGQHAVDGMNRGMARPGFNPLRHDGGRMEDWIRQGVRREDIEAAYAEGYRSAGMRHGKDAEAVAKAVVQRALAREADLDGSLMTMMSGDGREFMAESLRMSGLDDAEINILMERLIGSAEDRAKEGFAKSRNELDLNISVRNDKGLDIKLVDMMEADLGRVWQRYSRQVSGAAALARHGITNKLKRTEIIKAAQAEQRALGEVPENADKLHAMFSHFNAGPAWGFSSGKTNKGISIELATAKRLANLGLLEKLGITQLYETGAIIAQVGVVNWYKRGLGSVFDAELKNSNKKLLDEVSYLIGDVGYDELSFGEWFDWDEVSSEGKGSWLSSVSAFTQNAAYIQAYTSVFNFVRGKQQKVAVLGMMDKVFRTLRNDDFDGMLARFESDFGLGRVELDELQRMVDDGTIEFAARGHVESMNFDKWDPDLRDTFAGAMLRNMHQTVQKSMAGEQDAWMHTEWGSLMTHLVTFPIQAFQKQFIRNGQHMDMQALAAMSFGLGSAFVGINIRDVIDGKERTQMERARAAVAYSNMTGWAPMLMDPAFTILGMDDMRWSPYGPYSSLVPPVFTQMDNLRRLPGAAINAVRGETDYYDLQAAKAMPFAGTYFASRVYN